MEAGEPGRTLRVGVVGLGRWGGNLLRDLDDAARCRVDAICDRDQGVLSARAATYRAARPTTDVTDLFTDPRLDAIVIATGGASHAGLARAALDAGKHVFVEKPPALHIADAHDLRARAERNGVRLMVGHLMQYHPAVDSLAAAAAEGAFGRLQRLDTVRMNPRPGPADDDAWWCLGPHDVCVACRLFGEPVTVSASLLAVRGRRARLQFASGAIANLRVAFGSRAKVRRIRLSGTSGAARFDDLLEPPVRRLGGPALPSANELALRREVQHFVDGVLDGRPIRSDGADAVRVVAVLEAADRSLRSGRPEPIRQERGPEATSSRSPMR